MAFPESNNVHTMDNLVEFQRQHIPGVYHVANGSYVQVLINGNCPNLSNEGLCEIHQEPFFPKMCENALTGSEECKTVRRLRKPKA